MTIGLLLQYEFLKNCWFIFYRHMHMQCSQTLSWKVKVESSHTKQNYLNLLGINIYTKANVTHEMYLTFHFKINTHIMNYENLIINETAIKLEKKNSHTVYNYFKYLIYCSI